MATRAAIAHHEAGHAVACIVLGQRFQHVTVVPQEGSLGHILHEALGAELVEAIVLSEQPGERFCQASVLISLAGPAAERKLTGRRNHIGAGGDHRNAVDLALHYVGGDPEAAGDFVRWMRHRADALVYNHVNWAAIVGLADALLEHKHLTYRAACQVIRAAVGRHRRALFPDGLLGQMPTDSLPPRWPL